MGAAAKILLVEDSVEVIELLAELLGQEGYEVERAKDAAHGLDALRAHRFELVITDHWMPGQTGASMLATARQEGLLADTPALVLTADPEARELEGLKVLRKPVDFDRLLDEVDHELTASGRRLPAKPPRPDLRAVPGARPRVELVLYVTRMSAASRLARRNLERLLSAYDPSQVSVAIVDLSVPGVEADPEDRVAFTPTLVRRSPGPRTWLIGDLRHLEALRGLLDEVGIARRIR